MFLFIFVINDHKQNIISAETCYTYSHDVVTLMRQCLEFTEMRPYSDYHIFPQNQ